MRFSIRDEKSKLPNLRSQSGQGIVEYILVLIVVVAIILGGLYQLNTAFKEWAVNYFGTYLACLLEAGELPTIGGSPGDSGVCNELFQPFDFAKGRRLAAAQGNTAPSGDTKQSGRGTRESGAGGANSRGFSRVGGSSRGNFAGGRGGSSGKFGSKNKTGKNKSNGAYTGSTATGSYGGNYGATNRRLNTGVKHRLDNKFAFQDDRGDDQKKRGTPTTKKDREESRAPAGRSKVKQRTEMDQENRAEADTGMDFPNFMRYLIIAGIIIALILIIGGQMLQVGKSME